MSLTRPSLLGYISLCLIWGSTWLAIRVVVRDVPPLEAAALRFIAGSVLLLAMAAVQKRKWPADKAQWKAIATLSLTIMAIPYGLLFWAEQVVTSSMTAVLFSALPLVVALLTPLMMKSKVPRQAVFAMVVAFGGLLVLFYTGLSTSRRSLIAGLAILAAMLFSSWSVVYAKQRLRDVDAVVGTGLQLGFGSVALLWGTWALEAHQHANWTREAVLALGFLALFGSCIAFVIYYWLLKRMQPYQVSTINLVVPLVALMEGALLLHESVPLLMLSAVALVLGSVAAVLRASPEMEPRDGRVLMLEGRAE
ncbi:MAG TPA: EamA family transporter [Terriglobales bacterium]|nr:EamA family transporter [Terriglobales bacterium]